MHVVQLLFCTQRSRWGPQEIILKSKVFVGLISAINEHIKFTRQFFYNTSDSVHIIYSRSSASCPFAFL